MPSDFERQTLEALLDELRAAPIASPEATRVELAARRRQLEEDKTKAAARVRRIVAADPQLEGLEDEAVLERELPQTARRLKRSEAEIEILEQLVSPSPPWAELARTVFSMKEFLWLR